MNFSLSGKVVKGDGYGRKLGFPTVNVDYVENNLPKEGVYKGRVLLEDKIYRAGIVVGSPSDKTKVEAHLIGYNGDAYGKEVVLYIEDFIRDYKNFETEEKLINQIKEDLKLC